MRKIFDFPNEHCRIEAAMYENRILYEDDALLVCHKPAGIATQTARIGQADMVSEMENYLAQNLPQGIGQSASDRKPRNGGRVRAPHQPRIYVVHRLDQPVEGILVFARQPSAAAVLSAQAAGEEMEKEYLALVCDLRGEETANARQRGVLTDYLLKDGRANMSRIVPPEVKGAKEARLSFEILRLDKDQDGGRAAGQEKSELRYQVARIRLSTGRHHQIRVQMANAGMPLLGDRKYADQAAIELSQNLGIREIALCACRLSFCHPKTGERMQFEIKPEGMAFQGIRF